MVEDWYFELDKEGDSAADQLPAFDKVELFEKLKQQSEFHEQTIGGAPAKVVRLSRSSAAALAIAAMLILIFGLNFFIVQRPLSSPAKVSARAEHTVFNNNTAGILEKRLPDGSSVWLKPGASLVYERRSEESNREVTFIGEAFFEVAKDASHPFIISADEMKIKVIGTSFNVTALPKSRTFKVSVVSGKVQVTAQGKSGKSESVYLTPKQQASFNLASQKIVQTDLTETQLKKQYWKPFSLKFNEEAKMEKVVRELEKAFQVRIEFSNPDIANCYLKVDFDNQQLPEITNYLEKLLDVNCDMVDGTTLRIIGEGCTD
jgi:ferric-dicitrate binding protein FerR (iron transport regulator)